MIDIAFTMHYIICFIIFMNIYYIFLINLVKANRILDWFAAGWAQGHLVVGVPGNPVSPQ